MMASGLIDFVYSCDYIYMCVCNKREWDIHQSFIVSLHITHQFMLDYIVKSTIASKIVHKATHIDTFTSKNTKARIHKTY